MSVHWDGWTLTWSEGWKRTGALGKEVLIVVVHLDGLEVVDLMHLGWELGNQPLEDPIILFFPSS